MTVTRRNLRRRQITRKKHGGGLRSFLRKKFTQCFKGKKGAQCAPTAAATPSAARNSSTARLEKRQAARQAAAEQRQAAAKQRQAAAEVRRAVAAAARETKKALTPEELERLEQKEMRKALRKLKKEAGIPLTESNGSSGSNSSSNRNRPRTLSEIENEIREGMKQPLLMKVPGINY